MNKRVVITGMGGLGSTGSDLESMWQALKNGHSGIREIQQWDITEWDYSLGAELKQYNPRAMVTDRKLLKAISRQDVIGLNAAQQAIEHSGILSYRDSLSDATNFNDRSGVYVASPGIKFNQQYDLLPLLTKAKRDLKVYADKLFETIHPMWLLRILSNNVLAYTGIQNQFKGPNQNFTNHAAGGSQAMGEAVANIKANNMDRAVVVAYESGLEPQGQIYYAGIGALSKTGLRPFNQDHDGTILAEAGAAIMLESLESAKAREATIYGEILSHDSASEAMGIFPVREDGAGLQQVMKNALNKAQLNPEDLGMIIAHGNGTPNSDSSEAHAITQVFGEKTVPVTGFKWSTGHTVAAAGVLETLLTLKALRENIAPGIRTLTDIDPECQSLNISPEHQNINSPIALAITRGFSSVNACIVVRRWDD